MLVVARLAIYVVLGLAFALRVYRLDWQSFWYDEGVTAFMVGRDPVAIIEAAARDIHPPLYYLWIRFWSIFVGSSEFALRFSSVFDSVIAVALLARLANRLWGTLTAFLAASLLAIAPFAIVYAQEARMYALVSAFVLASFVCLE